MLISKFNFSLWGNKKKKANIPNIITEISLRLKEQQDRLQESIYKLRDRDRDLFDKTVRAQTEGDNIRAAIYAQEISDIRKMIKMAYTAYLALEKVRIRLETVTELHNISSALGPVVSILNVLKDQIRGVAPDVAIALDTISSSVNSIVADTGTLSNNNISLTPYLDDEAKKILEDAQKSAEKEISTLLPDLPHPPQEVKQNNKAESRMQSFAQNNQRRTLSEIDLLNYIKSTGGFLDIEHVAKVFNVEKDEVLTIIRELERKGLIVVED